MHRRLELPDDGLPMDEETADRMWRPWTPQQVRDELRDCRAEWMVAGGWALDLFLEQAGAADASRAHEDLEIAVPAQQFSLVRDRL
ncbi:MAG: nucleotidyltransferase domain-containing protein, partial [Actinomycetales bacterium]